MLNACGRQMKKPVIESRMFSRANKEHFDDILASAGDANDKQLVDIVVVVADVEEGIEETSDDDEVSDNNNE